MQQSDTVPSCHRRKDTDQPAFHPSPLPPTAGPPMVVAVIPVRRLYSVLCARLLLLLLLLKVGPADASASPVRAGQAPRACLNQGAPSRWALSRWAPHHRAAAHSDGARCVAALPCPWHGRSFNAPAFWGPAAVAGRRASLHPQPAPPPPNPTAGPPGATCQESCRRCSSSDTTRSPAMHSS
jgi:hypothetical protein